MATERVDTASPTATTLRTVLAVLGAAGLIVGSFLGWITFGELGRLAEAAGQEIPNTAGTSLAFSVYYDVSTDPLGGSFFTSGGIVTIVAGVLALLGILAPWAARVGGAIGLIAFVMFVITLYRAPGGGGFETDISNVGIGMWLVLVGSILALIAGFLRGERTVVTSTTAPPPVEP